MIKHKLELIKEFKEAREEGESNAGLADQYRLDHKAICCWLASEDKYKEVRIFFSETSSFRQGRHFGIPWGIR